MQFAQIDETSPRDLLIKTNLSVSTLFLSSYNPIYRYIYIYICNATVVLMLSSNFDFTGSSLLFSSFIPVHSPWLLLLHLASASSVFKTIFSIFFTCNHPSSLFWSVGEQPDYKMTSSILKVKIFIDTNI